MSETDTGRGAFYAAEALVHNLFERNGASGATGSVTGASGATTVAGTTLTLPPEAKFASVESIARYVDEVIAMRSVQDTFPRAAQPLTVRARKGFRAAEYRRSADAAEPGEIAIPHRGAGSWALRELVVLHEIAHHLDDTGGAPHDAGFAETLITLVGLVLGPEASFVYRVILTDSGAVRR
ncbi:hypothetical protein GOEFS_044_00180 [Gordonia effusa NBRC 100432]|uniref:TIGR04338 family metallohydrolase n=1 Tax=Gordonia effusa NBRC 100432 TaxID=1077974 RepID=H0QYT1_9ACTN|nr:TIGR04338 family metallohydrolase [Gordonia effusa]GAB17982.1 hypothetical protein GOEFS_044_00180 [Gordonia effusa NBRC 100432]